MEIVFEHGDVTRLVGVDAVVNPARTDLRIFGGIGGLLRRAGGAAVKEDVLAQAPLALGSVAVGSGGDLATPRVYHAAVVCWRCRT